MSHVAPAFSPQYLRSRIGKVCVAIIGSTPSEMIEKAEVAVRENPFVEFRLDYLEKPLTALPKLKTFLSERSEVTAVATCRRVPGGGKFKGKIADELEVLQKAATSGFHMVDVELQTAEAIKSAELEKLRARGAALIISYHDFTATKDLDGIFERIRPYEPEFIKIVSTAKSLADNVTMMHFLERTRDMANLIGICMGDQGIISRVLGIRAGSVFTFAAATPGEETGPGQIAARTLHETYRIDQLDISTRVYGVAGDPVRYSLSPLMINTAFRRETVNAVFLALQTHKMSDLLTLVREVPIHGLAVTMPLCSSTSTMWKPEVAAFCRTSSSSASIPMLRQWSVRWNGACSSKEQRFWCWERVAQPAQPSSDSRKKGRRFSSSIALPKMA